MKAAILYAAKSTADKHGSIPAQLDDGRKMAHADGWTVVDEFFDEDKSAYTGNRGQGLADAQHLAEKLTEQDDVEQVGIFIQHSDRLARGDAIQAAHLIEYALWSIKSEVYIFSDQDPQTFENRDFIYAALMGERNHQDSKRKSSATRDGIGRRIQERGLPAGGAGRRRFGYQWSESPKRPAVVIPFEADVVKNRMYRAVLDGVNGSQIGRELEADGIKTAMGGKWYPGSISKILRSPFYKGFIVYKGEEYPGIHDPIVDLGLWKEVNDYLAARRRPGRPKGQGRPPVGKHLFYSGTLRCICGEAMAPRTVKRTLASGEPETYERYACVGHKRDASTCPVKDIPRKVIDTPVFRFFERIGFDLEATRAQLAAAQESRVNETRSLLLEAERDAEKAKARLGRVERDYLDGAIEAADWNRFRDDLTEEMAAADSQVKQLAARSEQVAMAESAQDIEEDVLEKLAAIRASIAGEVNDSRGAEAARAAILRLFEGFSLREPAPGLRVPSELSWVDSRFVLEPHLREGAIPVGMSLFGVDENKYATVVRKKLRLPHRTGKFHAHPAAPRTR